MTVAKAYLEGSDVQANPSESVRLTVKLPPGTIDADGPRTPQVVSSMRLDTMCAATFQGP